MRFLRYPGSKRKFIPSIAKYLPQNKNIEGKYIEPFVGGGAVYLSISPQKAILNDINTDLIDLYKGIRNYPKKVWKIFSEFPSGKTSYYKIRNSEYKKRHIAYRAARILYLNRTCFKGMWRHGDDGNFNVGYGGEERRWVINEANLIQLSKEFKRAEIVCEDFEYILDLAEDGDFIFLDPPYKPGEKELKNAHYSYGKFSFDDQVRLANSLKRITKEKNIKWLMTNSNHREIKKLYKGFKTVKMNLGTSGNIGVLTKSPKEILIKNF